MARWRNVMISTFLHCKIRLKENSHEALKNLRIFEWKSDLFSDFSFFHLVTLDGVCLTIIN